MAKVFGLGGNVSGRAGAYVFRVRGGKTIMSQYNPIVRNPDTKGQSDQRAKFKLLTQLSSILRGAYGFGTLSVAKRKTRMTQANAFFKKNYPNVQITEDGNGSKATTELDLLQLTDGTLPLSDAEINTSEGDNYINARLNNIFSYVQKVRCVIVRRIETQLPDDSLNYSFALVYNEIQDVQNAEVTFNTNVTMSHEFTIFMYGYMKDASENRNLGNIESDAQKDSLIANLPISSKITETPANTTKTIAVSLA